MSVKLEDRITQQAELTEKHPLDVLHRHRATITARLDRLVELTLEPSGVQPHLVMEAQLRERLSCQLDGLMVLLMRRGLVTEVEVEAAKLEGVMYAELALRQELAAASGLVVVRG